MSKTVFMIGLGSMGWGIAANLSAAADNELITTPVTVWNRTIARSVEHAKEFGTRCARALSDAADADVIITCLPTSVEVAGVVNQLAPKLRAGCLWIDCTSGEPNATKAMAHSLKALGVMMFDCPVSGGPDGALSGQLTAMVGGDEHLVVRPFISLFAKKTVVDCGPVGAGHAVKAMNNCLNAAHLILGGEALLTLTKLGVKPDVALSAINASSGRSLQTEVRIPREVLSRKFDYGFKLGLMLKDVKIAVEYSSQNLTLRRNSLLPLVQRVLEQSAIEEGPDADYTCVIRTMEREAGAELRSSSISNLE